MTTCYGQDLIKQIDALQVPDRALAVWGMGQMGVALKSTGSDVIYIDLCLSDIVAERADPERMQRAFPPPVEPNQITNAAYVLCSHEHLDHADPLTLGPLAKASPNAKFIISGWAQDPLDEAQIAPDRRILPQEGQAMQLGDARLTAIAAAHETVENDPQKGQRWLGFVLEWNGITFYHGGDTLVYPGYLDTLKAFPPIDIALLAANGRDAYRSAANLAGNMLPVEAAWVARELGVDVLLGGHNDLYAFNTVEAGALPNALWQINKRQKFHVLQPGELYLYVK